MAPETIKLDPGASPLELGNGSDGFYLRSFKALPPARKRIEATSNDTEGSIPVESQYDNRTIEIVIRATPESTRSAWYTKIDKLQQKIAKINQERGQLERIPISGTLHYFDLVDAEASWEWDARYAVRMDIDITVKFTAMPFCYGAEVTTLGDHVENTAPALIFTESSIKGDVPGNGRLVIDNDEATGQWWGTWGVQSRYYLNDANAELFYEAEDRTILGGGSIQTRSGASGGSVVRSGTLGLNSYSDILSTQKVGGGMHMIHLGGYRVYARVYAASTGTVTLAFDWSSGDDYTPAKRNGGVAVGVKNKYTLVDLGLIYLQPIAGATLQWRGTVIGKSTSAADTIDIDYLLLVPTSEGSGKVQAKENGEYLLSPSKSMQFRSDGIIRQDGTGTVWVPMVGKGDLLKVPVAGVEQRTQRWIVKLCRGTPLGDGGLANPNESGDAGIDNLSAKLYYTPRWLMVPG
jgi:hypothetical protein